MIKLKNILNESPHEITVDGKTYVNYFSFNDVTYAFGFFKNKFVINDENEPHGFGSMEDMGIAGRDSMKFAGRIWPDRTEPLITFWEYPTTKKTMEYIIKIRIMS